MSDAPIQSYRLLRKVLPKSLQPILRGLRKRLSMPSGLPEPYRTVFPYTQAHPTRQENLLRLAKLIDERKVPGALVECGVLDGGTAAIMAFGCSLREVHLFDSWEGLPAVTAEDGDAAMWSGQVVGNPKRVVAVMSALGIELSRLRFHKGWFADTFPITQIDSIALLHIDGDFYDSVKLSLERWAPKMAPGGFIQIDDYDSFAGCTKAVDEFLSDYPELKLQFVERGAKARFIEIPDTWQL